MSSTKNLPDGHGTSGCGSLVFVDFGNQESIITLMNIAVVANSVP